MSTKTKDIPVTISVATGPYVTTDLNEYLMRTSEVNYKDRFQPSEEIDHMTTSAIKMQRLVAIEPKYVKNSQGNEQNIGRSYYFDDVKLNLYPDPKEPVAEYKGPEPWVKEVKEKKKKIDEELEELEEENKVNAGGDALKTIYMTDYTKKDFYKSKGQKGGVKGQKNYANQKGVTGNINKKKNLTGNNKGNDNIKGNLKDSGNCNLKGKNDNLKGNERNLGNVKGNDYDSDDEVIEIDENDPNYEYYMKMKKIFADSKTGRTIYKTDYCEMNKRKKRDPHAQDV